MKDDSNPGRGDYADLRKRAEEKFRQHPPEMVGKLSAEEIERLVHELQVYQIELEMQNEELQRANLDLEAARDRYADLYDSAPVGYVTINADDRICEANLTASVLLGMDRRRLIGCLLTSLIIPEDQDIYYFFRQKLVQSAAPHACELRMRKSGGSQLTTRLDAVATQGKGIPLLTRVVITDITERKRAEETLRRSENKFSTAFHASPAVMAISRLDDGRYLDVNEAFLTQLGYRRDEVIGKSVVELGILTSAERARLVEKIDKTGQLPNTEVSVRAKDGALVMGLFSGRRLDGEGTPCWLTIFMDNTERKRAEEKLSENEARLRLAAQAGKVGLWDWDLRANKVYYSPEWKRQIGYEEDEITDDFGEWQSRVHPNDLESTQREIRAFLEKPWPKYEVEFRFRHKDGSYRWILAQASLVLDENGVPQRMLGSHLDITERKLAKDMLLKEKEKAQQYFDIAGVMIVVLDVQANVIRINKKGCEILGYREEDILGRNWFEQFLSPRIRDQVRGVFSRILAGEMAMAEYLENYVLSRDGQERLIAWHNTVVKDRDGGIIGTLSSGEDITDHRRAEDALRESEQTLNSMINGITQSVFLMDPGGTILAVNETMAQRFERRKNDLIGTNVYELLPSDVTERRRAQVVKALATGKPVQFEDTRMGRLILNSIYPISDATGQIRRLAIVGYDMTELKKAEQAMRELAQYTRTLIEASPDPLVTISPEGKITDVNVATERTTGHSRNELIGTDFSDYFTEPEKARAGYVEAFARGMVRDYPLTIRHRNGQTTLVLYNASVYRDASGQARGIFAAARDITEISNAMRILEASERKYRDLVTTLNEGVWHVNPDFTTAFVNPRMAEMLEYDAEEMIGKDLSLFLDPVCLPIVRERFEVRKLGKKDCYETILIKKTGQRLFAQVDASPLYSEKGDFFGSIAVIMDITERKHFEEVLTLSNKIFQIANRHPDMASILNEIVRVIQQYTGCDAVGIRWLDEEGRIPYLAYTGFTDSFYQRESPLSMKSDECMCIYVIKGIANPGLPVISERGSFYCNGTSKFLAKVSPEEKGRTRNVCNEVGYESVALVAIRDGEKIVGLVHVADHREEMVPLEKVRVIEDIADSLGAAILRVLAEATTRESLAEKEELLREIHHRVKNNLASIVSLIHLQKQASKDPAFQSQIKDLEARIRSMALVHESIYQTRRFGIVHLKKYTDQLVKYLFQSYATCRIQFTSKVDAGDIVLPIETAIPCGLILSEMITNSLKYAFPDDFVRAELRGDPCVIAIRMEQKENQITLRVSDNGIGMRLGLPFDSSQTLGLYLLRFIVQHQLRGTIELDTTRGTAYTVKFSVPSEHSRVYA